jgi:hypothetical protein
VSGYYFSAKVADAIARNAARSISAQVPTAGLLGPYKRLQIPAMSEGFDALYYVRCEPDGGFVVEQWRDDIDSKRNEESPDEIR